MKKIYTLLMAMTICSAVALAKNEPTYLESIKVDNQTLSKDGREITLSMNFDFSGLKMAKQHTVALFPVLVSRDGSKEEVFPPIVLDGKIRNKVYKRSQKLNSVEAPPYHDDEAQTIIRRKNGSDQSYAYEATSKYQRWMLSGRVELREAVYGCVNCEKGEGETGLLDMVLPEHIPSYATFAVEPEPEPVKVREETREANINFRWDKYDIVPGFMNNRAELESIKQSIGIIDDNPDMTITGIFISGYASPEGSKAHNDLLTENRAQALAQYIRKNINAQVPVEAKGYGEDWDGLKRILQGRPDFPGSAEILAKLAENPGDLDAFEKSFRTLMPEGAYERLDEEIYPELRHNYYKVEYNVRNFSIDEARKVILERPELLSLSEMYKVAGSYERGSAEYDRAMEIAAEHYPASPAVLNDKALDMLADGNFTGVISMLEASPLTEASPALQNTLGVALAKNGELHDAEAVLAKAAAEGLEEAEKNLDEVRKVIDQL